MANAWEGSRIDVVKAAICRLWRSPVSWLVGLTLGIHAFHVWETFRDPAYRFPLIDAATYHHRALSLLRGEGGSGPYWQPPLYEFFLALVYAAVGVSTVVARMANAIWAALITLGVWGLGQRMMGRGYAVGAAVGTALCGPLLFYSSQLMPTAMGTALAMGGAWLAMRAWEEPSARRWLGSGFLWGASALAIPHLLAAVPAVAIGAVIRERSRLGAGGSGRWRSLVRSAVLVLGGALLAIAPVTIRNRWVGGQWVLISTNSGINFYIGNNPHAEMTQALRPGIDWDRLVQMPYRQGARNAVEADRYFWRESLRYLRKQPLAFATGLLRKGILFVTAEEIPRNLDLYTFRSRSRLLRLLVWRWGVVAFPFSVLGSLGLAGMILVGTTDGRARFLAFQIFLVAIGIILYFPTARYRAPLLPFFALFALGSIRWLAGEVLVPGWRWWRGVGAVAGAVVLVHWPIRAPTEGLRFDAELEYAIGAAFHTRGGEERKAAGEHYTRAIALNPDLADAHFSLGVWQMEEGEMGPAERSYREALRIRPDHDKARINLAILLFRKGAREEAAEMLEIATMLSPGNAKAWYNRGLVLEAMGRRSEATLCFRRAEELEGR